MFWINLSIAWRNIFRNKTSSIINVAGLAIGLTCALIITIFVRYELSFDRYHAKSENIYKVVQDTKMGDEVHHWNTTAHPLAAAIRSDFPEIPFVTQANGPVSGIFTVENDQGQIARFEEPYVLFVDTWYTMVFDFNWIQGNPEAALQNPNAIVLTQSVAKKFFTANEIRNSLMGKQIIFNNQDALTITGLIEDAPPNNSLHYTVLMPYEYFKINSPYKANNWSGNYQGTTFIVMDEKGSPDAFEQLLTTWKKKYLKPEDDNRISYKLLPLTESHTNATYGYAPQSYTMRLKFIYAAAGIGLFVLAIAAINFVNLATAQAAGRSREVGVRKVLGSSRLGLIRQFLHENIVIVLISTVLSLVITQVLLDQINNMLSLIRLSLSIDVNSVLIGVGVGVIVIMLSCVYPAVVLSSYRPVEALKNNALKGCGNMSLQRMLVVFQFAIVQVFVIGTFVVATQMHFLQTEDMGFNKRVPILMTNLNELEKSETFRQRLLLNPSITDVSFSSSSPISEFNHHYGTSFRLQGQREEDAKGAEEKGADLNYISFFELDLIAGRNFSSVPQTFNEFVVNEKLVRELGMTAEEAVGKRLVINEGEATIVGVVKDFHNNGLQDELTPCVLLNSSYWLERANIKIDPQADLSQTVAFIEKTWKEIFPDGIFKGTFLDDAIARYYTLETLIFKAFMIFSVLTIFIGCLGLYGLLCYITLRRTKEVGIRKALGASVSQIVTMFGREFVIMVGISFLIAAPCCYYWMNAWLSGFAYHIGLSWWMFVCGVFLTWMITIFTISYQTVRAASANPVEALRDN
jgi:ABC-type antimicrobial peptide transport system permease subunit